MEGSVLYHSLSDKELKQILDGLRFSIVMRDKIPHKDGAYIVNLGDTGSSGTHWVAYIKKGKQAVYCDSFGQPPPEEIRRRHKKLPYNSYQLQDMDTHTCGYFAGSFIRYMDGRSITDINLSKYINQFRYPNRKKYNDRLAIPLAYGKRKGKK